MLRPDVIALRQFYSSSLGRKVKHRLREALREPWPEHAGETILGLGYATPLLRALEREGEKPSTLVAVMPAAQGAIYWPVHGDNRSILAEETQLPVGDNTIHRVILLHALEHARAPQEILEECYRVLVPGGRVMPIVPNRKGLWARAGETPFRSGTRFRSAELKQYLTAAEFTLRDTRTLLFTLPYAHPLLLRLWGWWEMLFSLIFLGCGGVQLMEAEKQIYAAIPAPVFKKVKQTAWAGAAAPVG